MTALIHQSLNYSVESIKNLMHQIAGEHFSHHTFNTFLRKA